MEEMRKITVHVPESLIEATMRGTGKGVSETVRSALEDLKRKQAYDAFFAWRKAGGTFDFGIDYRDRKDDKR